MKRYLLKESEQAATGFTEMFVLRGADGDFSSTTTSKTINLTGLSIGDAIHSAVIFEVPHHFNQVGGPEPTTAKVSLGTEDNGAYWLDQVEIEPLFVGTTPDSPPAIYYNLLANRHIQLLIETDITMSTITGGELWVWFRISRFQDRLLQV